VPVEKVASLSEVDTEALRKAEEDRARRDEEDRVLNLLPFTLS